MSLFVLPVTAGELEGLQQSIQFFTNSAQATAQAAAINAGTGTVASYAASLLNANLSTSQVAMAANCLMLGQTATLAELDNQSTVFLPPQIANAIAHGFNQTVYAAEALGLALAGEPEFAAFTALDVNQFSIAVASETGVSTAAIQQFVTNWINFYTANPGATFGLTITQASYGAAFGDAIGVALLNPTSAGLQTVISTNAQGETVIDGDVANDLLTIATGQYVEGIDCDLLPDHTPLQGEPGSSGELTLTTGVDTPPAFQTSVAGAVFTAPPGQSPIGGASNTLNAGDTLVSTVGDATLNWTAVNVNAFEIGVNPSFAQAVNMTGIATANILNLSDDLTGFAGGATGITGLTEVNIEGGSNPFGDVQLGDNGNGLNTALETININAGQFTPNTPPFFDDGDAGSDLNVWIESSAFAGGEALALTLGADSDGPGTGGIGATVDLNVTGGANFYNVVNVTSQGPDANHLDLDTNADTITDVVILGEGDLEICGSALNQDTLTLFDSTASVAGQAITAFFEGPNAGDVTANGGAGDENFTFLTFDDDSGETTFTDTDAVDGGAGDNTLTLQAFEGALLGAGVGPNIVNIQTIVHTTFVNDCFDDCNFGNMDGDLTVDMANSGSATNLELAGWYDFFNVDVTNLTSADTVIYSGHELEFLTLSNPSLLGQINLTIAQDPCVEDFFGPTNATIQSVVVSDVSVLNIESTGNAPLNEIFEADQIDTNMQITGDVDLNIGHDIAYDFPGGIVDASTFEGNLDIEITGEGQTILTGLGDDRVEVQDAIDGGPAALIDLSAGGQDHVEFETSFTGNDDPIDVSNYHSIVGFSVTDTAAGVDTVDIDVDSGNWNFTTTSGLPVADGDPLTTFVYTTNTSVNADNPPGFNFIKVDTPVNLNAGDNPQDAFETAMGSFLLGNIDTNPATDDVLFAYYDATDSQMVLGLVDGAGTTINEFDDFDVIALVAMSKTDYDAFSAANLNFVV